MQRCGGKRVDDIFRDAMLSSIGWRGFVWARSVRWEDIDLERDIGILL